MGMMNGGMNGGDGSDDGDKQKKPVGYKSPPLHGRIKPGEVRNPHGHNGRQEEPSDNFEKVRRGESRVSFTTCSAGFLALEDLALIFVPSSLRRDPNPP